MFWQTTCYFGNIEMKTTEIIILLVEQNVSNRKFYLNKKKTEWPIFYPLITNCKLVTRLIYLKDNFREKKISFIFLPV